MQITGQGERIALDLGQRRAILLMDGKRAFEAAEAIRDEMHW